uniref:Ground-like domain-containing protein n=1 Tax=Angiostrongylus cantonensis TaxID=6313 RepID=A0A0K0DNN4_ANGCA
LAGGCCSVALPPPPCPQLACVAPPPPPPLPCPPPPVCPPQFCPPPPICPPPPPPPPPPLCPPPPPPVYQPPCQTYVPAPVFQYVAPPAVDCCCQCAVPCRYRNRRHRTHVKTTKSSTRHNMTTDPTISKRAIQKAAEEKLFGKFNVICAKGDFTYIAYTDTFCQASNEDMSCYAFKPL